MRATLLQFEPGASRASNLSIVEAMLAAALSEAQPELVLLPEMWSCLGGDRATKLANAEPLPPPGAPGEGLLWQAMSRLAQQHAITLHGGSIAEREGERLFNTTLVFAPDGREIARYRKLHLFDIVTPSGQGYAESSLFGAGESVVCAPAAGAMLGLSICYDLRFPELYLALRRAGAEVLAVPAAFTTETGRDHWEVLLRARAIETQCFVLAPATTGTHFDAAGRPRTTWGHSMVIDPWGRVVASLGAEPGLLHAELDLASLPRVRDAMPVLAHRRLV